MEIKLIFFVKYVKCTDLGGQRKRPERVRQERLTSAAHDGTRIRNEK